VQNEAPLAQRIVPSLPFIYGDLLYCARNEMIVHLEDLLRRRMPMLILVRLEKSALQKIAERVSQKLGWDQERVKQEVEMLLSNNIK